MAHTPDQQLPHSSEYQKLIENTPRTKSNVFLRKMALTLSASLLAACTQVAPGNSALQQEVQQLRQELRDVQEDARESVAKPSVAASVAPTVTETKEEAGEIIERSFVISENAERIDLQGILGNITVEVVAANLEQGLVIRGDERLVADFDHTTGNIETFRAPKIGSYSMVNGNIYVGGSGANAGISVINGVVQSKGYSYIIPKAAVPVLLLKLHEGKTLHIDSLSGEVTIGDTKGDLNLEVSGVGSARVGRVQNADLDVSGSGDITVSSVEGDLGISVSGSGEMDVLGGIIGRATVTVSGSGQASIRTHVQSLRARVSGSGDIYVKGATTVDKSVSGSGKVEMGS